MKIEVRKIKTGLLMDGSDIAKCNLVRYFYEQVYGYAFRTHMWQTVTPNSTSYALNPVEFNLGEMARTLRQQGWCVYYWRDRHGLDNVDDDNTHINYGRREGLIVGAYCANLTAWLLSNT